MGTEIIEDVSIESRPETRWEEIASSLNDIYLSRPALTRRVTTAESASTSSTSAESTTPESATAESTTLRVSRWS